MTTNTDNGVDIGEKIRNRAFAPLPKLNCKQEEELLNLINNTVGTNNTSRTSRIKKSFHTIFNAIVNKVKKFFALFV